MKIFIIFGQMGNPYDGDYEWWTTGACSSEEHAQEFIEILNEEEATCWNEAQEVDQAGFSIHIVPKNLYDQNQGMRVLGPDRENCDIQYFYHKSDLLDIKMGLIQSELKLEK